jgi:integrase
MVVTVVGFSGGGTGGRFAEHNGGCPLVTDELGDAAPDTCSAVWVQPAAPATRTTAIAARRAARNFRVDIGITVLKPGLFIP